METTHTPLERAALNYYDAELAVDRARVEYKVATGDYALDVDTQEKRQAWVRTCQPLCDARASAKSDFFKVAASARESETPALLQPRPSLDAIWGAP